MQEHCESLYPTNIQNIQNSLWQRYSLLNFLFLHSIKIKQKYAAFCVCFCFQFFFLSKLQQIFFPVHFVFLIVFIDFCC